VGSHAEQSAGTLSVGGGGAGTFTQTGGVVNVLKVDGNGGELQVGGTSFARGVYTIAGTQSALAVEGRILVGEQEYSGRFEWFAGTDTVAAPKMVLYPTPEESEIFTGTLAMGCDLLIEDLMTGAIFDGPGEVKNLDRGCLEISNAATATHEPVYINDVYKPLEVRRLNIGDSTGNNDPGSGTYEITGDFIQEGDPPVVLTAVVARHVFIGPSAGKVGSLCITGGTPTRGSRLRG